MNNLVKIIMLSLILPTAWSHAEVFLPGTQPKENSIRIGKVKLCKSCHSKTGDTTSEPYKTWQGGMMSQASRDPVYRAALAIANQDIPGVGEYCIRCHSPAGWMEGRSKSPDGSDLTKHDMHGVSCDICHRLVDPLSNKGKKLVKDPPPGYGSGMMVMAENKTAHGPYDDSPEVSSHKTVKSDFLASGNLCGTCHDVSNPLAARDIKTQPPETYGVIERTYSEWLLSDFSHGPEKKTCQSCHYPAIKGGGKAARHDSAKHRDYLVQHGPVGGSTWVQKAVLELWDNNEIDEEALLLGIKKAKAFLKTAASLDLSFPNKDNVNLRITNLTGHKLPTGYIEGRRMWINIRFRNASGRIIKEIGEYKLIDVQIADKSLKARSLLDADKTRVYECLPGLSKKQAKKFNLKHGKSFHFALNDTITFDNRIPPKGFNNKAFMARGCQPVGTRYEDGQYWDDITFKLPKKCTSIEAELIYEPVTMEYIRFLVEENRSDDWGKKLLTAWQNAGDDTAQVIASIKTAVK
jgi:hypothetical protein